MTTTEIFLRLGFALFLGTIIGFERKLVHKEAGMRTYGILSMACSTFMVSTIMIGNNFETAQETWRALSNVLGSIITGIGFLGVGMIFYSKEERAHVGLTSSATLLAVAGIGATCGLGFYKIAAISALMVFLMLTIGYRFEYALLSVLGKDDR